MRTYLKYALVSLALAVCPLWLAPAAAQSNIGVSDQKAGSVLVFPYYSSDSTNPAARDTRLTINNVSNSTLAGIHIFLIDGSNCSQTDMLYCLTPNGSLTLNASTFDPDVTGYMIVVAVDINGCPTRKNVLTGDAFVKLPAGALGAGAGAVRGNYSAESFWAYSSPAAGDCDFSGAGNGGLPTATLRFDGSVYDQVPSSFVTALQSPSDVPGQTIVVAGLRGDIAAGTLSGGTQVAADNVYNADERARSYSGFIVGTCQGRGTITTSNPRVLGGMGALIPPGSSGTIKFKTAGGVGVLLTPSNGNGWSGARTLHKLATTSATLAIPIFGGVC